MLLLLLVLHLAFAFQRTSSLVSHTITVKVYLPDGVAVPQVVKVELYSDRTGQPLQMINLMKGETTAVFYGLPNGEYAVSVDAGPQFERFMERFSLRNNFSMLKQLDVFLTGRVVSNTPPAVIDVSQANVPKEARKAFEKGLSKLQRGKVDDAVKSFEEAVSIYPDYFEAVNGLAVQYIELKQYDKARKYLARSMELAPQSPLPYLNLGIFLLEQRFYREAIETLEYSLKLDGANPMTHYQLGIAYFQSGDLEAAQKRFETTVETASRKIPMARLYLADVYKKLGRKEDACTQIEYFLRDVPHSPFTEVAKKELASLRQQK
ncbi:MAG: tetratricopeptide repeat protein [Acidobacteriota bacterium]|nr:tetratricopeptide repeat protein [Blastocatellia bacterium]MDW8413215.1 tetratricopeptide repeat protein [Acidobacteriota bacterium]